MTLDLARLRDILCGYHDDWGLGFEDHDITVGDLRALLSAAETAKEQHDIVARIWKQLGSPIYEQLAGRSIHDLIDEMKRAASTAEQREKEARREERERCRKAVRSCIEAWQHSTGRAALEAASDAIRALAPQAVTPAADTAPGHTDLMVSPEEIDDFVDRHPPPAESVGERVEENAAAIVQAARLYRYACENGGINAIERAQEDLFKLVGEVVAADALPTPDQEGRCFACDGSGTIIEVADDEAGFVTRCPECDGTGKAPDQEGRS
ncbi:MAG: hypothetical protein AB7P02_05075 [Alphaproteobacteria bacterium]